VTPVTILTSNRTRDLHDAVKRRCLYHWLDYPERERELAIVRAQVPGASDAWPQQVALFVSRLRSQPFADAFQRAPGIAESVEWAKALVALDTLVVDPEVVSDTAGILFKQREDVAALTPRWRLSCCSRSRRLHERSRGLLLPAAATGGAHAPPRLGDARSGKLADNLTGFGRALRRAGVPVDAARMALAQQALLLVGLARHDMAAALEAVLISREQDRQVFRELFDAYFRNPDVAQKLLAQMLPTAPEKSKGAPRRPRVADALAPLRAARQQHASTQEQKIEFDAAMTASDQQRLRRADFNQLSASEYQLVQRLVREVALPLPRYASRRTCPGSRGSRPHWAAAMRRACPHGRRDAGAATPGAARPAAAPAGAGGCVGIDGALCTPAAGLLARRHSAGAGGAGCGATCVRVWHGPHRFDTRLRHADGDAMLAHASAAITDFAGGTRLGEALHQLRRQHARRLVGRRTLVLLISDGLDTGEPAALLQELGWLRRHCGQLLWLNPLLRYEGYRPTARGAEVLHRHAHGMLAVHNLESLQQLAHSIAAVLQPQRR
jgi:uncharacterized protein with von Willebrand factor type A (vWA) domain